MNTAGESKMLDIVKEVVYDATGIQNITPETDFIKDLALNSFDIMNIVCAFEQRFSVSIPTREVWQLRQVKDVLAYMKSKGIK